MTQSYKECFGFFGEFINRTMNKIVEYRKKKTVGINSYTDRLFLIFMCLEFYVGVFSQHKSSSF